MVSFDCAIAQSQYMILSYCSLSVYWTKVVQIPYMYINPHELKGSFQTVHLVITTIEQS